MWIFLSKKYIIYDTIIPDNKRESCMVDYDKLLSEENVERLKLYSHDSKITKLVGA
jgi:hypothetical protein